MRLETGSSSPVLTGLCAALLASGSAFAVDLPSASPESVGMSSERLGRLDAVMHGWVDAGRIAGVVTLARGAGR
jgi:hypothetical protein